MNVDGGIQINDIGGILRRRGKVAGFAALGVLLAIYWIAMALPNVFTSYATVLVEPQGVDKKLVEAGVAESDLNQRLHLMTAQILARPRLSRIIDEFGLYAEESKTMLRDEVINLMRGDIRVEPVIPELEQAGTSRRRELEISEFKIFYSNYDPVVAKNVAQRLANDFIETHINTRVQTSQKSLDFIQGELDRLAKSIARVEKEISRVKGENPRMLPEDMATSQRQLERVLVELTAAQRALGEATSDEEFYRSQLAAANAYAAPNDDASPVRRLELLKLQLGEFESRGYTDKHPDIVKTREEIARLEKTISSDEEAGIFNPIAQQAESSLRRALLQKAVALEEIERLRTLGDEIQGQLEGTPVVAEQLDALNRDYEHLFNTFQDFSKRHNEAAVQAQLERKQLGEQFRVLEQAFEAPEPSAPNRALILVVGFLFALMAGGAAGLLREALDTSPHDARQLQTRLQLPVLASIPAITLESDRVRERRARFRTVLATAGVVGFALVGGAANYLWVNGVPRSFVPAPSTQQQAAPDVAGGG